MEFARHATQELTVAFDSSQDAKEQVRQAIDIVDLVGSYVQLRRQGRGYVALCPWHDDSRPSLQVNPERQSFKCWVCDIGGDVFSFLMKMEGVDFREALAMLADRAGITLQKPERHVEAGQPAEAPGQDKRTLYRAAAWAERQFHECLLQNPDAEPARRYLQERGITAQSIEQFQLGFSPLERDWLIKQAGGSPSRTRILETIGILARPQSGSGMYDRFRGRVLFSIHDAQGRPVGTGGRLLPDIPLNSPAKYVNSPETPLFRKSHLLYGLDLAKDAIRKSRTAMVMEGYTDVIVAHQYGFNNAVAVLGTALGENHVRILKRFADRILLVLDGDEAGQKRANEVLELFVAQQVDLQILTLPDDLDPCDFLHERGAEAFSELLAAGAVDALDHAFRSATRGIDLDHDVHAASQALERLVAIVAKAPRLRHDTTSEDRIREGKFLQRFAALFRVDEAEVRRHLTALRRKAQSKPERAPSEPPAGSAPQAVESRPPQPVWRRDEPPGPAERELMEMLVAYPQYWEMVRERLATEQVTHPVCRLVYETGCRMLDSGDVPEFGRLMLAFDDPSLKSFLVELDEQGRAKGDRSADAALLLEKLIKTFQQKEVDKRRPAQIVALRERKLDTDQETALLESIIRQERNRQGISDPMDG
jgi:DNA primase